MCPAFCLSSASTPKSTPEADQVLSNSSIFGTCTFAQGLTYILILGGPWLPFYLCGFLLSLSLFFMTIYPTLIQPLFNKCQPLPEGSLRAKIEALVSEGHRRSRTDVLCMFECVRHQA